MPPELRFAPSAPAFAAETIAEAERQQLEMEACALSSSMGEVQQDILQMTERLDAVYARLNVLGSDAAPVRTVRFGYSGAAPIAAASAVYDPATFRSQMARKTPVGASRTELTALLGSTESTLRALRNRHNAFHAAAFAHREACDTVKHHQSLLQQATGKMEDSHNKLNRVFLSDSEQARMTSEIEELEELLTSARLNVFGVEPETGAAEGQPKTCSICLDAPLNAVLNCGHPLCRPCAEKISRAQGACPSCRVRIVSIQSLFL
jgi:hypothetical protein